MYCVVVEQGLTRPPHSAHASTQDIWNIYTQLFNFNFNYQHTTRCFDCGEYIYKQLHHGRMHTSLYYSVTAHPDDGQARPKDVGATNWENIYHLCILLVFVSNYTKVHGVKRIEVLSECFALVRGFCTVCKQYKNPKTKKTTFISRWKSKIKTLPLVFITHIVYRKVANEWCRCSHAALCVFYTSRIVKPHRECASDLQRHARGFPQLFRELTKLRTWRACSILWNNVTINLKILTADGINIWRQARAFTIFREAKINFVMFVRLSFCLSITLHRTTRLPLNAVTFCHTVQIWLKWAKHIGGFTWGYKYCYDMS
jgi:hypothetical protein